MTRRSGQSGYLEQKGNCWVVRFWQDVEGSEKRAHRSIRVCPLKGPGALTKPERERRAKEIIAESGADSEELFNRVQAVNLGATFGIQADRWLTHMAERKQKPCKPATLHNWKSSLRRWVLPQLGSLPLSHVDNSTVKPLVCRMAAAGRSSKCIATAFQIIRAVVASAKDEKTRKALYPVTWDYDYLDLPIVTYDRQPSFNGEEVTRIVCLAEGQFQMLYALLAGTGLRSGEVFGLEVGKHITDNCSRVIVEQSVWYGKVQSPKTSSAVREADLVPELAQMLKAFIGNRTSGFLFRTRTGNPLSKTNVLRRSLHPVLQKLGWVDPKNGSIKAGFHAFRRFRVTWLRKNRAAEDLIRFWLGHAGRSVTDDYSMIRDDIPYRKQEAERLGLGFEIPSRKPDVVPNPTTCTQNVLMSHTA